ncbi:MCE family protein [Nibribacter ruber]|uniref:MCE family protein n=1 Tax=Nibribacter ruber TaxID=2698458 RepID=A0A6P1P393_9BACT|nr:MlaD family protein [Nibribacter ruber]QHL88853.1 MCE family protein [Nibribacter ruber]
MNLSKELKVALLGLVAVAALYVGFLFLKGSSVFSSSRTFYVTYKSVSGLTVSNPVILNGLNVGIVKEMTLQPAKGNQVVVTVEINEDIQIGDSTVAMLVSSDLLGGKAIELYMGQNKRQYDGGENLIPFVKESITDLFASRAMPVLDTVDSTLIRLNSFLDKDAKRSIQSILMNAEATSEAIRAMTMANQGNINQIAGNLAQLTAQLQNTEKKFSQLASNLNEITDTIDVQTMNQTIRNMNATVTEAQLAMKRFNESNGSLNKFMNDDSLYRNLNASSASLNALLMDLKANPKRYVHFSLIGGGTKVDKAENVKEATKVKNANTVEKAGTIEEVEKK